MVLVTAAFSCSHHLWGTFSDISSLFRSSLCYHIFKSIYKKVRTTKFSDLGSYLPKVGIFMITFNNFSLKYISQKSYDDYISKIELSSITCPCCSHLGFHFHAYYKRSLLTHNGIITLKICRIICPHCHKTHAILPVSLIPYTRLLASDVIEIILDHDTDKDHSNLFLDPVYFYSIFHRYHSFLLNISYFPSITDFFVFHIHRFHRNFAQLRGFLFIPT